MIGSDPGARRFLVSSVVRHADLHSRSGFVRLVDLNRRRVVKTATVPESAHRAHDPNPRGGLRGVRGVAVCDDRAVVANSDQVMVFDTSWRTTAVLSHPLMAGIHDVLPTPGGIWVTSTSADLLVEIGWDGRLLAVWEWRRDRRLVRELGFRRLPPVDRGRDYRDPEAMRRGVPNMLHFNGVSSGTDGLLLSFGRVLAPRAYRRRRLRGLAGAIASALRLPGRPVRYRPPTPGAPPVKEVPGSRSAIIRLACDLSSAEVALRVDGVAVPNHNVLQVGDLLVYNDSNGSRLAVSSPADSRRERAVAVPGGFTRGLAHLGGMRFLVGNQSPLAVYQVDLEEGRIVDRILLDGRENESVYGIWGLPDDFEDLPDALTAEDAHGGRE